MVARELGVGLIGTGFMGKCHALAWQAVAAVFGQTHRPRLVHLADISTEAAQAKARELGFARGSGDWRSVMADAEVDIVSIAAPNPFHAEMTIAALEAGKHVWCEKPMATRFADAQAMAAAAARLSGDGRVAALGYNYIQSPAIRQMGALLQREALGRLTNIRIEMDEDFMADTTANFGEKDDARSGYGALDDFAVHTLSLLSVLVGLPRAVMADQARSTHSRMQDGQPRAVETCDIASALLRFDQGLIGTLQVNRAAWGRKGRIGLQIMGTHGSLLFDQERFNEFQLYMTQETPELQGFRTILMGPRHAPYERFVPAPGHNLGFNDLKIIEAHEIMTAIAGHPARLIDFARGLEIERCVHAMARSAADGAWVEV